MELDDKIIYLVLTKHIQNLSKTDRYDMHIHAYNKIAHIITTHDFWHYRELVCLKQIMDVLTILAFFLSPTSLPVTSTLPYTNTNQKTPKMNLKKK